MKYAFDGPMPDADPSGELVHPGDVREIETEPEWGPWRVLDEPPAEEPAATPPSAPPVSARALTTVITPAAETGGM